jgi:hypothetical protein
MVPPFLSVEGSWKKSPMLLLLYRALGLVISLVAKLA